MTGSFTKHFARTWYHHTPLQLATLTVLTGTFVVVSAALLIHQNLENLLTRWGRSAQVSVYLQDDISKENVTKVKSFLENTRNLEEIRYISKEQALEDFKKQMSDYLPDLLFDKEAGHPLPASFVLSFSAGLAAEKYLGKMKELVKDLSAIEGVEDVAYGQSWVENYASLVGVFKMSSLALILILLLGSLFVVGNSIRSSISQRREEIEILELVGATRSMIRMPYILEGAATGVVSSVLAMGICYLIFTWQTGLVKENMDFWMLGSAVEFLRMGTIVVIVVIAGALGALGSFFCVSRISNGWAAAEGVDG